MNTRNCSVDHTGNIPKKIEHLPSSQSGKLRHICAACAYEAGFKDGVDNAVHQLVEGPVSAMWPATILQHHPHVTVLIDTAAASRLQLADYYRSTYAAKPRWQGL